jgi:hypothetical protein
MSEGNDPFETRNRILKVAFGLMALVCLLAGLAVYVSAGALGLDQDTADLLAIAFLAAGVADYLILRSWDRIAKRR